MKINIKVKTGAKQEVIRKTSPGSYDILVKEPAREGRANGSVLKLISSYFHVPVSNVKILKGKTSKRKVISF